MKASGRILGSVCDPGMIQVVNQRSCRVGLRSRRGKRRFSRVRLHPQAELEALVRNASLNSVQQKQVSKRSPNRGVAVELCCGMGGMGIGLRELGFEVKGAFDVWDEAVAVYNHNFGEESAHACNLLQARGRDLVSSRKREIKEIELLAAGPPCKGFSQLRNGFHDGRNGHNRVIRAMPGYVALLRPRMFLIENVAALASHRGGKTLEALLDEFQRPAIGLRYRVEWGVYDAAAYGTPQARRRILILGVRDGSGVESLPNPDPELGPLFAAIRHSTIVPGHLKKYQQLLANPASLALTSANQALSDLPSLGAGSRAEQLGYATAAQGAYQRWVRHGAPKVLSDVRTPARYRSDCEPLGVCPSWRKRQIDIGRPTKWTPKKV